MATTARKELSKALRATFADISEQQAQLSNAGGAAAGHAGGGPGEHQQHQGEGAASSGMAAGEAGTLLFEDYAPSEELLEAIEIYAGSSEIQALGGQDRDLLKLQEVLLEDCYNEGILSVKDASLQTRSRSAIILVLAKFASLDSQIVSPAEIRYVWWMRLLKPALVPQDPESYNYGSRHAQEKAGGLDHIRLGREAAKAAKEMLVKALCAAPDDKDNAKWRNEIFSLYSQAESGSFEYKSLQEVLIAFCKAHPMVRHLALQIASSYSLSVHRRSIQRSTLRWSPRRSALWSF